PRVLVVDDDPVVAESLCEFLRGERYRVSAAADAASALAQLEAADRTADEPGAPGRVVLGICDVSLPGMNGLGLLRRTARDTPGPVVTMLTPYGTIESAVQALRLGASDYLTKPVVDS